MDDQLERETRSLEQSDHAEARAQEGREMEGAADDEPRVEHEGAAGLPRDPVLARREVSRHLRPAAFPAGRDELVAEAEANAAPEAVLELLRRLPAGETFSTVYEAWDALGQPMEPGAHEVVNERGKHPRGGAA